MTIATRFAAVVFALVCPSLTQAQEDPRFFELTTSDGITMAAYEWAGPDHEAPYVVLFHQAGGNALGEYTPIVPQLRTTGFNVLAVDQRSGGDLFEGTNRTVERLGTAVDDYCQGLPDLEAALDYVRTKVPGRKAILWGSSYSAALVILLAEARPDDVAGVLAFSPATGDPMDGCRPEPFAEQLSVPLLAVRPRREAAIPPVAAQLEELRRQGHDVHVFDPGVHGSSTLVEARVKGDTSRAWELVLSFLRSLSP